MSRTSVDVPMQRTRRPSAGVCWTWRTSHSSSRTSTCEPAAMRGRRSGGVETAIQPIMAQLGPTTRNRRQLPAATDASPIQALRQRPCGRSSSVVSHRSHHNVADSDPETTTRASCADTLDTSRSSEQPSQVSSTTWCSSSCWMMPWPWPWRAGAGSDGRPVEMRRFSSSRRASSEHARVRDLIRSVGPLRPSE